MKINKISLYGICVMLSLSAGWLHAQPLLNGLAINTEFNKERFIAALYSDALTSDADAMLSATGHRRMELKIVADSISARAINSLWIEGMAINNPASALEAEAQNLAKLSNMIRKRLRIGDVLAFDAIPDNGTAVTLNGVKLGTINSDDFFPMLLRTWIGSIPLSSDFKDSLLASGDVDSELSSRYRRIEPNDTRIDAVAAWVTPEPPRPDVVDSSVIQPPRPDSVIVPPRPTSGSTEAPAPNAEAEPTQVAQDDSESAEDASAGEPTVEPEASVAAEQEQDQEPRQEPAQVARATPTPTPSNEPKEDDEEGEEDAEEVMITAETLLLRQRYVSDVMRQTLQNMRYPRRALERTQQGSIRLAVTVARNGELRDVQIVEESRYSLLNREALASVERASPFSEVPAGVGDEDFSFGIPVTFRLQ